MGNSAGIKILEEYSDHFIPTIPRLPQGRYASFLVIRETMSHAIFTTEGDILDTEKVQAGLESGDAIDRVVMFKRKQVAPERRTGKALLRQYGIVPNEGDGACYLIGGMCGSCPDCLIYGYAAVEGQGARKSRVITDSGFSVRPYEQIQKMIKFNVIDEETMTSGTITEFDHIKPQVFIPTIETCIDVIEDEFIYVLGNVLRTTRYGKEATREGYVRNHLVGIAFSDVELFSNLEFTQAFYDAMNIGNNGDRPLTIGDFTNHLDSVIDDLKARLFGSVILMPKEQLKNFQQELREFWSDSDRVGEFLTALQSASSEVTTVVEEEAEEEA